VGIEFKSVEKPVCGVNTVGVSESPLIQLTISPGFASVIGFELALVVVVPGLLGLVIAETMGGVVVFVPATAKKCRKIGS
jgi:hypothetical protein